VDMPIRWKMKDAVCDAYEALDCTTSAIHGHHHFLLTLITRGKGIQIINGVEIPFEAGDLFILSPADFHQNVVSEGASFDYFGVKFLYELLDPRLTELCAPNRFPVHLHMSERNSQIARQVFAELVEESQNGKLRLASSVYCQKLVDQLFVLALREMKEEATVCGGSSFNRALGFLYSHFHENITVSDVAAYMGYTPNYFSSSFRQTMGVPFTVCLRQMRLNYAEILLRTSKMTATEIAMEAGYGSLSHFTHRFIEAYGVSPQKYRKHAKDEVTNE